MEDISNNVPKSGWKLSNWEFPLQGIISFVAAIPVTLFLFFVTAFASDAPGPNPIAELFGLTTLSIFPLVVLFAIMAQVFHSRLLANIGIAIPIIIGVSLYLKLFLFH